MSTATEEVRLAIPDERSIVAIFENPESVDELIGQIEAEAKSYVPDLETASGRKAIASLANKVARSKVALDEAGKRLTEEARKTIDTVNAERRKIRNRLDGLKADVRKPLTDWEEAEEARVSKLRERLEALRAYQFEGESSKSIGVAKSSVEAIEIDETWEELEFQAGEVKEQVLTVLRKRFFEAEEKEAKEAELARLRAKAEEEERLRKEAEEKRLEEERKARAEAERKEREERERREEEERKARLEEEKRLAAERAKKEAEEKAKAEAERQRKEAEEREAALKREIAEAKEREERAAQAERDRIAEERRVEEEARKKREADEQHRRQIFQAIEKAIVAITSDKPGAEKVAKALLNGSIPHVEVKL